MYTPLLLLSRWWACSLHDDDSDDDGGGGYKNTDFFLSGNLIHALKILRRVQNYTHIFLHTIPFSVVGFTHSSVYDMEVNDDDDNNRAAES